jgi:hypothetical protein
MLETVQHIGSVGDRARKTRCGYDSTDGLGDIGCRSRALLAAIFLGRSKSAMDYVVAHLAGGFEVSKKHFWDLGFSEPAPLSYLVTHSLSSAQRRVCRQAGMQCRLSDRDDADQFLEPRKILSVSTVEI